MSVIELDAMTVRDNVVDHLINMVEGNIDKISLTEKKVDGGQMLLSSIISDLNDLNVNAGHEGNSQMATLALAMKKIVILFYLSTANNEEPVEEESQVEDITNQVL